MGKGKDDNRTLVVAGGEDDGAGLVADEALRDPCLAEVGGGGATLLEHRLGANHLDRKRVAARPGLQLVHLREHRLPHCRLRRPFSLLLLAPHRRHSCTRRNPNPGKFPKTKSKP